MNNIIDKTDFHHNLFVKRVASSKVVWALKHGHTLFKTHAKNETKEDHKKTEIVHFWMDKPFAQAWVKEALRFHIPTQFTLPVFLEDWCFGMNEDGLLAGINWEPEKSGETENPLILAHDILEELKANKIEIAFTKHKDIEDLLDVLNKKIKKATHG